MKIFTRVTLILFFALLLAIVIVPLLSHDSIWPEAFLAVVVGEVLVIGYLIRLSDALVEWLEYLQRDISFARDSRIVYRESTLRLKHDEMILRRYERDTLLYVNGDTRYSEGFGRFLRISTRVVLIILALFAVPFVVRPMVYDLPCEEPGRMVCTALGAVLALGYLIRFVRVLYGVMKQLGAWIVVDIHYLYLNSKLSILLRRHRRRYDSDPVYRDRCDKVRAEEQERKRIAREKAAERKRIKQEQEEAHRQLIRKQYEKLKWTCGDFLTTYQCARGWTDEQCVNHSTEILAEFENDLFSRRFFNELDQMKREREAEERRQEEERRRRAEEEQRREEERKRQAEAEEQRRKADAARRDARILIFDTETTGLPKNNIISPKAYDSWPHIVQIAWVMCDGYGNEKFRRNFLIRPDGYEIPDKATQIHGITTDYALRNGEGVCEVMSVFMTEMYHATRIVCHNYDFDSRVVAAELYREGIEPDAFLRKPSTCTMLATTSLCHLPGGKFGAYKWPRLQELHQYLFGCGFDDAHDAMADVDATKRCYIELLNRGEVHL